MDMNVKEIENNVQYIINSFTNEELIYGLLLAYSISKTSAIRLKKVTSTYLRMKKGFFTRRRYMFEVKFIIYHHYYTYKSL